MRPLSWPLRALLGSLVCLLCLAGCAVERGTVYVKDGARYGVISGWTWRGSWWDFYERGSSYATGEFCRMPWFSAAIAQRQQDQRNARTYGMHFVDYFHIANWASSTTVLASIRRPYTSWKPP
jgi:hypothetical protein